MENYNLELPKAVNQIKAQKAKLVLIQLPDGLKPKAKEIKEKIEKETNAKVLIWLGSCFGSCDIPNIEKSGIDLLIQWGHSKWK
ncbi:diphthamide synthesis protein [Candidatus Woesearchaeota archaeon]|nr:diphthamide synthesis protein [Candidatus Woesearchaeota archaeon]